MVMGAVSKPARTGVTSRPRTATKVACKTIRELHPVQQAIYRKVVSYLDAHDGAAPTRREIASSLGIAEGGYIRHHLLKLQEAGLIVLVPGARRGIRLPDAVAPAPETNAYDYFISHWQGA
jgi:SOS-response transcriptional repressor LexA